MKNRPDITALVCSPHCRFYKPGKKEELACRGYIHLAARISPEQAEKLLAKFSGFNPPERFEHDPRIESALCSACEFRAEDCDFMSEEEVAGSVPCGGYVFISRLLEAGLGEGLLDE